jgi:homeodomain interacting protein kinase
VDYAHCNNVKASVQMMEVCRRNDYNSTASGSHHQPTQQAASLVNFVPGSNGNVTFTINNQLTNQVQRLVRDRSGYDNLVSTFEKISIVVNNETCSTKFTTDERWDDNTQPAVEQILSSTSLYQAFCVLRVTKEWAVRPRNT